MARSIAQVSAGSSRNRGVLLLAAVFGILSAMLMFAFLSNRGGSDGVDTILNESAGAESVVVMSQDVPFGTVITSGMVSLQSIPSSALVEGRTTKAEDVIGKVATTPLFKGQQLVQQQFTTFEGQNSLTYKVPPGMRAVSMQVPHEAWIVGGLPQPGDRVDFLAITTLVRTDPLTGQERPDVVTGIIAQNIEVLAVSQTIIKTIPKVDEKSATASATPAAGATPGTTAVARNADASAKPLDDGATYEKAISITLAMEPEAAAKAALVDAMKDDVGQYRLLLRRQGDSELLTGAPVWSYEELFPAKKK